MKKLNKHHRHSFIGILSIALIIITGFTFKMNPKAKTNMETLTGKEVISRIKSNVTCEWSNPTVDTFKEGNPEQTVTGIAVTLMATMDVLQQAVNENCNLIITHEPTYYNHLDNDPHLQNDTVVADKRRFIQEHNLMIFRFHDHWHMTKPDGIYLGMIETFGWEDNRIEDSYHLFSFEEQNLKSFAENLASKFPQIIPRIVGDPGMTFTNVAFSAGAPGSARHFNLLQQPSVEVLIAGEAPEWETTEYVRDASLQGKNKAVIFLGHVNSEEAGMNYCASWLRTFIQEVPVTFIEAGDPYWTVESSE